MALLADMEMTLDTTIAELTLVNKVLTSNTAYMTQFFTCCNRIVALIELMRQWQPSHGCWACLYDKAPFNGQTKLKALAESVEAKIRGKVQTNFALDMRAVGSAHSDVQAGGQTLIDLTGTSRVQDQKASVVELQQGITAHISSVSQSGVVSDQTALGPPVRPPQISFVGMNGGQPSVQHFSPTHPGTRHAGGPMGRLRHHRHHHL